MLLASTTKGFTLTLLVNVLWDDKQLPYHFAPVVCLHDRNKSGACMMGPTGNCEPIYNIAI